MVQNRIKLLQGDCLELMDNIPDKSVDMILCDLPYGTCASKWDKRLPMDDLWIQYKRVAKRGSAIVLFSQQPFTSLLICSNLDMYKYNWIWEKENGTNFLNSHFSPLKITEDICVFSSGAASPTRNKNSMTYNPQFSKGKPYSVVSGKQKENSAVVKSKDGISILTENSGIRYPTNLIRFKRDACKVHPTQKPVALLEYLIRTYSNEGDTILDNTMGSGSTGVACINTDRNFIGIELDKRYFHIACDRIGEAEKEKRYRIFL